jgi:ABC-type nitrate/sulfonate/bicarbonate transport system substrate-binding protein
MRVVALLLKIRTSPPRLYFPSITLVMLILLPPLLTGCGGRQPSEQPAETIRIGYPVTTLINGQIGQILERTNILQLSGLTAEIVQFTHGPPTNEALAAGRIDVGLTSEGPAVVGISQGIPAVVAASFGTTRDALLVHADSPIRDANGLRGKTIGVPFGTTPFMHLVSWLQRVGLTPDRDVKLVNISPEELAAALASKKVDGVEYNEPLPTSLEMTVGARVVSSDTLNYALLIRRDFLAAHQAVAVRFLAALAHAVVFMATHQQLVNGWYAEVSRADAKVIHQASMQTPAYARAVSVRQVDLGLSPEYISRLQQDADFFADKGFTKEAADMHRSAEPTLWQEAEKLLDSMDLDLSRVEVNG